MRPAEVFAKALRHHQAGELAEADRLYARLLKAEPSHVHGLHLRGVLAHQAGRHDDAIRLIGKAIALDGRVPDFHYNIAMVHWTCGRRAEAADHWARAVALKPDHADAQMNLGNALCALGRPGEAAEHLRRALALGPRAPAARSNLGLALAALGQHAEAVAEYRAALGLKGDFVEAHMNLAASLQALGQSEAALGAALESLRLRDSSESKTLIAEIIASPIAARDSAELRALVLRALAESWGRQTEVAAVAAALLRHDPDLGPLIARAAEAWPRRLATQELAGALPLEHALLRCLMESERVGDAAVEQFLVACRRAILELAETDAAPDTLLGFACALARQCFITEYVQAAEPDERERAGRLRDEAAAALAAGGAVAPLRLAAVASYFPLHTLGSADALLSAVWPAPLDAVLTQQVREPREEARERESIAVLTPIADEVSRQVQSQYEESPYPRWARIVMPQRATALTAGLRRQFPWASFEEASRDPLDVLVAGCGTGRHALYVARLFAGAKVLAIDLSRASLAYAQMRTRTLGVTNVRYAQADILALGGIDLSFDLIESDGVLHHLGDPFAGWRVLLARLRPGGFMHLGLYSEIARQDVVAARAAIAARGIGSSAEEIRRFREELMSLPDGDPRRSVMRFHDFFSLSDCRDLLFHVSEHRLTLPAIKGFLDANRLRFIGFDLDPRVLGAYRDRFPQDRAMADLDNWHMFETENPQTFAAMYRFWIQKPMQA